LGAKGRTSSSKLTSGSVTSGGSVGRAMMGKEGQALPRASQSPQESPCLTDLK
jgi:hypothetical protein